MQNPIKFCKSFEFSVGRKFHSVTFITHQGMRAIKRGDIKVLLLANNSEFLEQQGSTIM